VLKQSANERGVNIRMATQDCPRLGCVGFDKESLPNWRRLIAAWRLRAKDNWKMRFVSEQTSPTRQTLRRLAIKGG